MAQIRKFHFETCFDDEEEEELVPPAPEAPPPLFTEAELDTAKAEAFAAGQAAGAAAESAAAARRTAEALERVASQLDAAFSHLIEAGERAERRALETGMAMARAFLPNALRSNGLGEVEALLRECLGELLDEPRLVVRVADEALDPLNERLSSLASRSGFAGRVILLAEDGMGPGDCRIEWADGGVERNGTRMLRDIEAAAARLLPPEAPGNALNPSDTTL